MAIPLFHQSLRKPSFKIEDIWLCGILKLYCPSYSNMFREIMTKLVSRPKEDIMGHGHQGVIYVVYQDRFLLVLYEVIWNLC